MDGSSDKGAPVRHDGVTQPEADDPEYLAWLSRKIEQGQRDMRDQTRRHSEHQVWREHGFDDNQ